MPRKPNPRTAFQKLCILREHAILTGNFASAFSRSDELRELLDDYNKTKAVVDVRELPSDDQAG